MQRTDLEQLGKLLFMKTAGLIGQTDFICGADRILSKTAAPVKLPSFAAEIKPIKLVDGLKNRRKPPKYEPPKGAEGEDISTAPATKTQIAAANIRAADLAR